MRKLNLRSSRRGFLKSSGIAIAMAAALHPFEAIVHGAVKRIRPKLMTVAAAFMGLMPIMWSLGTGADMMKRVVAPMVGGLVTSFILELLVYPPIYEIWKWREVKREIDAA